MREFIANIATEAKKNLHVYRHARNYLAGRGIPPYHYNNHDIGYLPSVPPFEGEGREARRYFAWRQHAPEDSIVLPVRNFEGTISGLVLRAIKEKKYDQFILAEDTHPAVFFGLKQALPSVYEKRWALITEGAFDYLAVCQHIPNSLALLTNQMSAGQKRMLRRFTTIVALGLDEDGDAKTEKKKVQTSKDLESMGVKICTVSSVYKDWNKYCTDDPVAFKEHCADIVRRMEEEISYVDI